MEKSVTIRHAEPEDYDHIVNRVDAWWSGRQMAMMLPRLFFTHFRPWTYVAVQADSIVGFLAGFQSQTDATLVYCHFIGVDPGFRGRGIGEALYQRLFSEAVRHGCQAVLAVTSQPMTAQSPFTRAWDSGRSPAEIRGARCRIPLTMMDRGRTESGSAKSCEKRRLALRDLDN